MIPEITIADGSRIWVSLGDSLSGPGDHFGTLHLNATSVWISVNGGHWKHSRERRLQKTIAVVEQCETAEQVRREVCYE